MNRPTLLGLLAGAVVLACCLAVVFTGPTVQASDGLGSTGQEPGRAEAGSGATAGAGGDGGRFEVAPGTGGGVTLEPDAGQAGTDPDLPEQWLEGRVLDAEHEPVAEAWVITDREHAGVRTDEDGRFRLLLAAAFDPDRGRTVTAWKEGMSIEQKRVRMLEGTILLLEVDAGKEMRVVDADSSLPIAGAELRLLVQVAAESSGDFFDLRNDVAIPCETLVSDADGTVRVPDPASSESVTVEVVKEGYDRRLLDRWELNRRDTISLSRPEEFAMRFVDADGVAHAGAQICFPWYRRVVSTDADGWAQLPSEARWGFWGVQVVGEGVRWIYTQVDRDRVQDGATLATAMLPRTGRLHVQGDESPQAFEVGTTAAFTGWRTRSMPDPRWNAEAVRWVQVAEDGSFDVSDGWQGDSTQLHVRRAGSRGVLMSETLVGEGPYELTLTAATSVTVLVEAPHPEQIEGATLKFDGRETRHEDSAELAGGLAELRLPHDRYRVSLTPAGTTTAFPLGEIEVFGSEQNHVLQFAGMRRLAGRVTAAGRPVFPCRIEVRGDRGFRMRVETDPSGAWKLDPAPDEELRVRIDPGDDWLDPVENDSVYVPRGAERCDVALPTATLLLSVGSFPAGEVAEIDVRRSARSGVNASDAQLGAYFNERTHRRSTRVNLPDLRGGPVEILTTPGEVRFDAEDAEAPLASTSIELEPGAVRSFRIDTLPTSILTVRVRGFEGRLHGRVGIEPVDVPALMHDYPGFRPQELDGERLSGQLGDRTHLLPGTWRVTARAPFWAEDVRDRVGQGRVTVDIQVGSRDHTLWLRLDEQDRLVVDAEAE